MTITETSSEPAEVTEVTAVDPARVDLVEAYEPTGLAKLLGSGDHKSVGRVFIVASLLFALADLVLGVLNGLERLDTAGIDIWDDQTMYFQTFSLHQTALVFLVVMPLLIGLAMFVVPLQIGAPGVAFPRLAAASLWTWLVGSGILVVSILVNGGPGGPGDAEAIELTLLAQGVVVIALLAAAGVLATTIIASRPAGMSLFRVPLFTWSVLVAAAVWMVTLPVLVANLVITWIDMRGATAVLYGTDDAIAPQLAWVYEQPQVYAFAIPLLGITAEIVPVAFGRRQRLDGVVKTLIGLFGALALGAYAQPFFNPEIHTQLVYVVGGLLIVVPLVALFGAWGDSARGARPNNSAALVLALTGSIVLFLGALAGFLRVLGPALGALREFDDNVLADLIDPLEDLIDTSLVNGQRHLVLLAALIGGVAGLYHWGGKIWGRRPNLGAGLVAGLLLFAGALLYAVPDVISGWLDQPADVAVPYVGPVDDGVEALNAVSMVGGVLLAAGVALVLVDLMIGVALGKAPEAEDDPWGGHTLEWATTSPPPEHNFEGDLPEVTSSRPLLDMAATDDGEDA